MAFRKTSQKDRTKTNRRKATRKKKYEKRRLRQSQGERKYSR